VEILGHLIARHELRTTDHHDLAMHREPREYARDARTGREFVPLARLEIGVEHEPAWVHVLEENSASTGLKGAILGHSGCRDDHGIDFWNICRHCLVEPVPELGQGGARSVRLLEPTRVVVDAHIPNAHDPITP